MILERIPLLVFVIAVLTPDYVESTEATCPKWGKWKSLCTPKSRCPGKVLNQFSCGDANQECCSWLKKEEHTTEPSEVKDVQPKSRMDCQCPTCPSCDGPQKPHVPFPPLCTPCLAGPSKECEECLSNKLDEAHGLSNIPEPQWKAIPPASQYDAKTLSEMGCVTITLCPYLLNKTFHEPQPPNTSPEKILNSSAALPVSQLPQVDESNPNEAFPTFKPLPCLHPPCYNIPPPPPRLPNLPMPNRPQFNPPCFHPNVPKIPQPPMKFPPPEPSFSEVPDWSHSKFYPKPPCLHPPCYNQNPTPQPPWQRPPLFQQPFNNIPPPKQPMPFSPPVPSFPERPDWTLPKPYPKPPCLHPPCFDQKPTHIPKIPQLPWQPPPSILPPKPPMPFPPPVPSFPKIPDWSQPKPYPKPQCLHPPCHGQKPTQIPKIPQPPWPLPPIPPNPPITAFKPLPPLPPIPPPPPDAHGGGESKPEFHKKSPNEKLTPRPTLPTNLFVPRPFRPSCINPPCFPRLPKFDVLLPPKIPDGFGGGESKPEFHKKSPNEKLAPRPTLPSNLFVPRPPLFPCINPPCFPRLPNFNVPLPPNIPDEYGGGQSKPGFKKPIQNLTPRPTLPPLGFVPGQPPLPPKQLPPPEVIIKGIESLLSVIGRPPPFPAPLPPQFPASLPPPMPMQYKPICFTPTICYPPSMPPCPPPFPCMPMAPPMMPQRPPSPCAFCPPECCGSRRPHLPEVRKPKVKHHKKCKNCSPCVYDSNGKCKLEKIKPTKIISETE